MDRTVFGEYANTENLLATKLMITEQAQTNETMSKRIGISTVKVIKVEKSTSHPFREGWTGKMEFHGSEVEFSTDIQEFRENKRYRVVWERTEPVPGEQIIELHEIVDDK